MGYNYDMKQGGGENNGSEESASTSESGSAWRVPIEKLRELFPEPFFHEILSAYVSRTVLHLEQAHSALAQDQPERAGKAIHSLRGASLQLEIIGMALISEKAEKALHKKDVSTAKSLLDQLDRVFDVARKEIEAALGAIEAPHQAD